jgi:hypothetical protein
MLAALRSLPTAALTKRLKPLSFEETLFLNKYSAACGLAAIRQLTDFAGSTENASTGGGANDRLVPDPHSKGFPI